MLPTHLSLFNKALSILILLTGFALLLLFLFPYQPAEQDGGNQKKLSLQKNSFEANTEDYALFPTPLLDTESLPPPIHIPDLRSILVYHGKNGRPDMQTTTPLLHFSLTGQTGSKGTTTIEDQKPLYLTYDRQQIPPKLIFQPSNTPTALWIEPHALESEAEIQVKMLTESGEPIPSDANHDHFRLPEKELSRVGGQWEVGGYRADGALLSRQKARWLGPDRFLERHGGEDYAFTIGRQRIEFGEGNDMYAVFVKAGDCLVWKNNRWWFVEPGPESIGLPLLVVKKIEDRVMALDLWDPEGKSKIPLNLMKHQEAWNLQNPASLQQVFKFVGSQTKKQSIFLINNVRTVLSPQDWLLMTPKGWKKLSSREEIDAYVQRKLIGTLLIFEKTERRGDKQLLIGILYNPSHTEFQQIEIPVDSGPSPKASSKPQAEESVQGKQPQELKDKQPSLRH